MGWQFRIGRDHGVTGCETETANKNGESKIGRLSKLPVEERNETGGVKHERENFASLQLPITKEPEVERQADAPKQVGDSKNWSDFQNDAAQFAFGEKKDGAAGQKFRTAIGPDAESVTADGSVTKKKNSLGESAQDTRNEAAGDGCFLRCRHIRETIGEHVHAFFEDGQAHGDQKNGDHDKEISPEGIHRSWANDDDQEKRSEHDQDREKNRATAGNPDRNDEGEPRAEEEPVAISAARHGAVEQISGGKRRVENDTRDEGESSGRPDLSSAGGDLLSFAESGGAIDERFRIGIELEGEKQGHRQQTDQNPPAEFLDVVGIERAAQDEDERQVKEVAAKTKTGDEEQRFERQIRFQHEQRNQPGKQADDAERQDPVSPRKQAGLDREHVNHDHDRVAHDQKHIGILREEPFAKNALENEEQKIDPDRPLQVGDEPLVSRRLHGEFGRRKQSRLIQQLSRARSRASQAIC